MPRRLPSLNALRSFEAAARLGRMTSAADELCVTHGAISRSVRALQDELGVVLFEPGRQPLTLTPAGRHLLAALGPALDQLADAVAAITPGTQRTLDVSCLSTLAMRWLIPRLHQFHEQHPHIDVRLRTTSVAVQMERERCDVVIDIEDTRQGATTAATPSRNNTAQDIQSRTLFAEQLGLVLSPQLAHKLKATGHTATRKRPPQAPLLQTQTRPQAWADWAQACGAQVPDWPHLHFAHYSYTLEAALGGLGLAIAPWHLVLTDIHTGRLIAPWGFVPSGLTYRAQYRPRSPGAEAFSDWLQAQVAQMDEAPVGVMLGNQQPLPKGSTKGRA